MSTASPAVQHISDTARWAAVFRAIESRRPDALFRDPFAERLAGPRGFAIASKLSQASHSTSWIVRTHLFDQFIARAIEGGADLVVNLGAGLDARPYRMALPASLHWIEVDAPEILAYKKEVLRAEKPACALERRGLNLLDRDARRALLGELRSRGRNTLVLSEGLLIYFDPEEVATLAEDLGRYGHFQRWVLDIASPAVLSNMQKTAGQPLAQAGACFRFGPAEGAAFFTQRGWRLVEAQSVLKNAVKLGRTPIDPRLLDSIPDSPEGAPDSPPWLGVCAFERQEFVGLSPI